MALSKRERLIHAYSNGQGLSRSKYGSYPNLEKKERRRETATPRQIDITLRQANGKQQRSREDMEKLIDNYTPNSRLGIMCQKKT
jgi:DNA primase catalytic subunit